MFWLDGTPTESMPLPDRGMDFGDGLFETLLLNCGRALYPELHLQRLQQGLSRLDFPDCLDRVEASLALAAQSCAGQQWSALRITVTRGSAPRGYAPPDSVEPRILMAASPIDRDCSAAVVPARVAWAKLRLASQPALAGLKHLNRLEQVLVASEARAAGVDEMLVTDQQGQAIAAGAGNLFVFSDGRLLTPELSLCGVAGTRRRLVLEQWASRLGLSVAEMALGVEQVEAADELFYCNSLQGIRPVAQLGPQSWSEFPIAAQLHQCFLEDLSC